jgi:hypothetical protein
VRRDNGDTSSGVLLRYIERRRPDMGTVVIIIAIVVAVAAAAGIVVRRSRK